MAKKMIFGSILVLLLILAIFQAVTKEGGASNTSSKVVTGTEQGMSAPSFSLKTLEGTPVKLEDFKGKKVLLNFWATWCPPCKAEMPAMQQLHEEHSQDVVILAVNLDPQNDVTGFVKQNGLTFTILLDQTGEIQEDYTILSIPSTYLIDEEGIIQKKQIGSMSLEQMQQFIE